MKNSLLREELLTIFKNKKILIPIIAVLFIPVLYAGMFLWAFWNPYNKFDKLPVAIVNEDNGAKMAGKHLKLGDDLVKELTKSKEFGFKIVDKDAGYKQLKDQKYYMLIEIPKDFSKNATTLLNSNPKKLELKYVPNESYNFLSAQIGGTAAEKIKTAVAEKVTKTYAETMFKSITKLADGINQASDGAGQLSGGTVDVTNGSKDLNEGLATLAEKSIEFNNGIKSADSGADQLASGSAELSNGLSTFAKKSVEFNQGVDDASSGSKTVAAGSNELNNGLAKVDSNLPLLIDGTSKAYSGAEQLKSDLPAGISAEIQNQLTGSMGQLNTGIDQFKTQLTGSLASQIADQTIAEQTAKMQELAGALIANGISPELVNGIMTAEQQSSPTKEQLQQQISSELSPNLDGAFTQFKTGVSDSLSGATNGLEGKIKSQTDPYFNQLISGIGTINNNQKVLQQGIHDLYVGSTSLSLGTNKLSSGMNQLSDGADQITSGADKLADGSNELKNGSIDLSSGMNQLTAGAGAITSGAGQLADGSNQLQDGTSKLSDGAKVLADKLATGAKEASKVHSNDKTYDMMAKPVKLETKSVHRVPNYGTGFTPYFLSLGLFVGALIFSIVFPIREPAIAPANGFNWFISKFSILACMGIIQALLADTIILTALDLQVQSVAGFILFSIITSLTFVTLIQLLVTVFADVGRFIAILILIFQLTTSAGTFPLETIPEFLQHFNAFLPMTYSVRGFKTVVSSGDYHYMWQNLMILLSYVLVFALGTFTYLSMRLKHHKNLAS